MLDLYSDFPQEGVESIKPQLNDPFVKDLRVILTRVKDYFDTRSGDYKKLELTKEVMDMEKLIEKRFGIKTKIRFPDAKTEQDAIARCIVLGFDNGGGISSYTQLVDKISRMNPSDLKKSHKDFLDRVGILDRWAKVEGIIVDEEKAVIKNLPSDISMSLVLSFEKFFKGIYKDERKLSLTVDEACAIVLHEIGHAFTLISYAYKSHRARVVFQDILRDQQKKGTEPKKQILMAYKEAFNNNADLKKLSKGSYITTALLCTKDMLEVVGRGFAYEKSKRSTSDAEFLADQFAARFGLGVELSKVVNMGFNIIPGNFLETIEIDFYTVAQMVVFFVLFAFSPGTIAQILGVSNIMTFILVGVVISFVSYALFLRAYSYWARRCAALNGLSYDVDIRRAERISNDIVRQIRLYSKSMSKEEIDSLINASEEIDRLVERMKKYGMPGSNFPVLKIFEFFSNEYVSQRSLEELDVVMENLMENKLHVASMKF